MRAGRERRICARSIRLQWRSLRPGCGATITRNAIRRCSTTSIRYRGRSSASRRSTAFESRSPRRRQPRRSSRRSRGKQRMRHCLRLSTYYRLLVQAGPAAFNLEEAARLELDWWQAWREAVGARDFDLTIAKVAALITARGRMIRRCSNPALSDARRWPIATRGENGWPSRTGPRSIGNCCGPIGGSRPQSPISGKARNKKAPDVAGAFLLPI